MPFFFINFPGHYICSSVHLCRFAFCYKISLQTMGDKVIWNDCDRHLFFGRFLLRANICAFFIPMVLVTVIALIKHKRWKILWKVSSLVSLGVLLFILPFLVYLIANDALWKCVEAAYMGVLGDFSPLPMLTAVKNVYEMIWDTSSTGTLHVAFAYMLSYPILCHKKRSNDHGLINVLGISFWGLILNLFASSLSGAYQPHYSITFVPIMVIPSAWIFSLLFSSFQKLFEKNT